MSVKSKQYIIDGDQLIDLLAREQLAKELRPTIQEWGLALNNVTDRTIYRKVDERIAELKKERGIK